MVQKICPKKFSPKKFGPKNVGPKKICPKKIVPKNIGPKKIGPFLIAVKHCFFMFVVFGNIMLLKSVVFKISFFFKSVNLKSVFF